VDVVDRSAEPDTRARQHATTTVVQPTTDLPDLTDLLADHVELPDFTPVASRPRCLSRRDPVAVDLAILVGVVLLLAFLWGRGRGIWYWLDEGLSVGISSHPLADIPGLLRQDGSPPLYYGILHVWVRVFGSSEASTHTLSLFFALGSVVAAWWAGRSLFGRRAGWFLMALAAVNPFLATYANETRMYALIVLLSTVATATFVHSFVFRRRRYLPVFVIALALLAYTHNWGLFLVVSTGVALIPCLLMATDRRRLVVDAFLAFGTFGLMYLPWVPTLLFQRAHTGAPWAIRPTFQLARWQLADLVGGQVVLLPLGLGAGGALAAMLRRPRARTTLAVVVTGLLPLVVFGGAWVVSREASVWTFRYLAVALPPVLVVAAVGLAGGGRLALAALCVVAFLTAPIDVRVPPQRKSNVKAVARDASAYLRPGDLVISEDGEIPVLAHYLPPGLRYSNTEGLVPDEYVSDQRDYLKRLQFSRFREALPPLVDALPPGAHVLHACPSFVLEADAPPFSRLLIQRCEEIRAMLVEDPDLHVENVVEGSDPQIISVVLTKQRPPGDS